MAAYVQGTQSLQHFSPPTPPPHMRRHASKQRFVADLSQCLFDFVIQLLPTAEEMTVKEDVRKLLERLIRTIEPDSRLLSFGSTANGFSLRNSDMDLCCLIDSNERLSATDLVTMLGDLLERETKFHVKPLPHARIPIVKLSLTPSPGLPLGIACDIGFENRLALENTRLLMCYALIDPTRVRTMVLFLKVWSKRRKINSPYKGTLSSYGYVLMVIYFLVHVKNPPVLPNLQQVPPLRPIPQEETHMAGHNVWFFDDIELLRQRWQSSNTESVAELLIDFFRYYSRDFSYNTGVASIRAGLLKKESKGWQHDLSGAKYHDSARERNRFCIEDPFETDYNVARCVTKDGLYTIRGEFMRGARILAARPERAIIALAQLCEERKEDELVTSPPFVFSPPRLSPIPPQTPYTVGSNTLQSKAVPALSSHPQFFEPGAAQHVPSRSPPEHMAPKRSKWTSPPPPEAPPSDHSLFEDQFGLGLELATSSTDARESSYASSSNSEILSGDDDRSDAVESDDAHSIRSFTEGSSPSVSFRGPPWLYPQDSTMNLARPPTALTADAVSKVGHSGRGRLSSLLTDSTVKIQPPDCATHPNRSHSSRRIEFSRRSSSGPPRASNGLTWSTNAPIALVTPLPPSPVSPTQSPSESNVVYETTGAQFAVIYPGSHSPIFSQRQQLQYIGFTGSSYDRSPPDAQALPILPPDCHSSEAARVCHSSAGPDTPTPISYSYHSHSHSHSTATITAPTPPPHRSKFTPPVINSSPLNSKSRSSSPSSISTKQHTHSVPSTCISTSPRASTSNGSSPSPSSAGYATSLSRSPSLSPPPPSPTPPPHTKLDVPDPSSTLLSSSPYENVTIPSTRTLHIISLNDVDEDKDPHCPRSIQDPTLPEP